MQSPSKHPFPIGLRPTSWCPGSRSWTPTFLVWWEGYAKMMRNVGKGGCFDNGRGEGGETILFRASLMEGLMAPKSLGVRSKAWAGST